MNLADLISSDASDEIKDLAKQLAADVEAEKQKGIDSYRKKDSEALKLKNYLKELGYDKDSDGDVDTFVAKKKEREASFESEKVTIETLNHKLLKMEADAKAKDEQIQAEKDTAKKASLTAELTNKIGKDYHASNLLIKDLVNTGKVDLRDGNVVFVDGDNVIGYDDGVASLRTKHPDLLKTQQNAGTGDNGGETPAVDSSFASMLKAEISK